MKKISLSIVMIFIPLFLYGQEAIKIMYVTAENGLRQRDTPSLDGRIMGSFLFGERISILERTNTLVTIDGVTDYWYKTWSSEYTNRSISYCWVFGGYLSEEFPSQAPVILGAWLVVLEYREHYRFYFRFNPDHTFSTGPFDIGEASEGTWEQNGNNVVLKFTGGGGQENWSNSTRFETLRLQVIDKNNIILHSNSSINTHFGSVNRIILLRSNDTGM